MQDVLWTANDRKALRRRIRIPCQVVRERDFSLLSDVCVDMSPDGLRVKALRPAALGTEVLVSFRVPDAGIHMDLSAVVTRVARGRRRGESFPALGLSFLDLSPLEGAILRARLRNVPPPAPTRHLRVDYAACVRAIFASLSV